MRCITVAHGISDTRQGHKRRRFGVGLFSRDEGVAFRFQVQRTEHGHVCQATLGTQGITSLSPHSTAAGTSAALSRLHEAEHQDTHRIFHISRLPSTTDVGRSANVVDLPISWRGSEIEYRPFLIVYRPATD